MPRAIFFIKIARSYLFTSALSFHLFLPQSLSVLAFAFLYSCLCFSLFLSLLPSIFAFASIYFHPVLPSILAPDFFYSHLCFHLSSPRARSASQHPRFTSRRSFSHDFSLPRHTLFGIKLCIANSFPVIWPYFVLRHTFFLTKVCIASRVGQFVVSLRRAGVFLMPRHTLFGMKLCIANSFPVIWPCFVPRHTFYRTKVCIASKVTCLPPDFQLAIQVFSIKRVCRRQKTHTLNQNATAAHENLLLRVCRG